MQSCFINVASELVRLSLAFGAQYPLLKITLGRSVASPNRARGVPVYNPVVSLSWGPAEWIAGVQLVDRNGYPVQWLYADAYKWLAASLNGAEIQVQVLVRDASYIPPKWTAKRVEKAQLRIALDAGAVYVEADDKTTKAMALAMSAKRAALLESARCLEESAAWLTAAQALAANTGIENWVTPGDAGGGGDTGGGDTGGGDTGGGGV